MARLRKKILGALLGAMMLLQTAAVVPAGAEVAEEMSPNLVGQGSFEDIGADDTSCWKQLRFNVLRNSNNQGEAYDGDAFIQLWGVGSWTSQELTVEPNTTYTLKFAYKNDLSREGKSNKFRLIVANEKGITGDGNPNEGDSLVNDPEDNKAGKTYEIAQDWTVINEQITTGDNSKLYLVLKHDYTYGEFIDEEKTIKYPGPYVDAIELRKNSYVRNGSFEDGNADWEGGYTVYRTSKGQGDAYEGDAYARTWGSGWSIRQMIEVEKDTNYQLSYAYKNESTDPSVSNYLRVTVAGEAGLNDGYPADKKSLIGVSQETTNEDGTVTRAGRQCPLTTEWTVVNEFFNTGDNTKIYLAMKNEKGLTSGKAPFIDAVKLQKLDQSQFVNGSFEYGESGWEGGCTVRRASKNQGEAYEGDAYAKIWGVGWSIHQKLKVEKDTYYVLRFAYRNESTDDSSNPLRVAVAGSAGVTNGYPTDKHSLIGVWEEVKSEDGTQVYAKVGQYYPKTTEWTPVEEKFYTGDNDTIYVIATNEWGTSAGVAPYLDAFSLEKYEEPQVPEIKVTDAQAAKNGQAIDFTAKLSNTKLEEGVNGAVIAAVYNAEGALVNASWSNVNIAYQAEAADFSTSVSVDQEDLTGYTAALYLWDRAAMTPFTSKLPVAIQ